MHRGKTRKARKQDRYPEKWEPCHRCGEMGRIGNDLTVVLSGRRDPTHISIHPEPCLRDLLKEREKWRAEHHHTRAA